MKHPEILKFLDFNMEDLDLCPGTILCSHIQNIYTAYNVWPGCVADLVQFCSSPGLNSTQSPTFASQSSIWDSSIKCKITNIETNDNDFIGLFSGIGGKNSENRGIIPVLYM